MKYLTSSKNETVLVDSLPFSTMLLADEESHKCLEKSVVKDDLPSNFKYLWYILNSFEMPSYMTFFKRCFSLGLCMVFTYSYAAPSKTITDGPIIRAPSTKRNKKASNTSTFSKETKIKSNERKLENKKSNKKTGTKTKKEDLPKIDKQQSDADKILLQNKKIKSIWLSSIYMPGLGQIRNNKIWKAGVIWTGFAGLFAGSWYLHKKYISVDKKSAIKRNRTEINYRIYRNACFVASFFWYVLNVLDAYVDAHMTTFDISKNLASDNIVGEEKKRAIRQQRKKNKRRKKRNK